MNRIVWVVAVGTLLATGGLPFIPLPGNLGGTFGDNRTEPMDCTFSGAEGRDLLLDASCPLGPPARGSVHRWDLNDDSLWDTPWADASEYVHAWGDDFDGQVRVQRGTLGEGPQIVVEGPLHEVGALSNSDWLAQTIVPTEAFIATRIGAYVAINWGEPANLHVWIRDTLEPLGENLSHGQIPYTEVPRGPIGAGEWPIIDIDDVRLEEGQRYYVIFNMLEPTGGAYEGGGVGLVRPDWPLYGGNLTRGWYADPDDNLGLRIYAEVVTPSAEGQARVAVTNVAPTITDVKAYVVADVTLRVAGEKWHDVRMDVVWNGQVTGSASVVRMPGSPDRQTATIGGAELHLLGDFSIVLTYTPEDDPPNGQPNGATPAWVVVTLPDGSRVRLHHTFNVRHPATWTWTVEDVRPNRLGVPITLRVGAEDPGSDDLTFAWDFGDRASASATSYNDGVRPDPFPSPDGTFPFAASDAQAHAYALPGSYVVDVIVADDDGGSADAAIPITVWGPRDLKLEAAAMLEEALLLDPGDADLMDALGYLYMSLGDNDNASRFGMGGSEVRWAPDGIHVDDAHGRSKGVDVFQYEEESVDKLIAYLENDANRGTGVADVIPSVIEWMRDADRYLATIAIADAETAGGDPALLAVAWDLLAEADVFWEKGDLSLIADYVIDKLEESWEKAIDSWG